MQLKLFLFSNFLLTQSGNLFSGPLGLFSFVIFIRFDGDWIVVDERSCKTHNDEELF